MKNNESKKSLKNKIIHAIDWPKKRGNRLSPWYVIILRLTLLPMLLIGLCIAWVAVALSYGPRRAIRFWRDAT